MLCGKNGIKAYSTSAVANICAMSDSFISNSF